MKAINKAAILVMLCLAPTAVFAQDFVLKIPVEVESFVDEGMKAIVLKSADLNGDGTKDFILVTKNTKAAAIGGGPDEERILMILTRKRGGELTLAKRSYSVVYSRFGVLGDPYADVQIKRNSFTVFNYVDRNMRSSISFQFNYSRRDRTWQLVLIKKEKFNPRKPTKFKTKIYPPKNFGKIDIADFDSAAIP